MAGSEGTQPPLLEELNISSSTSNSNGRTARNNAAVDVSTIPEPPPAEFASPASEYDLLLGQITQAHACLDNIRKNLRYHLHLPCVVRDLELEELRGQVEQIEAIAVNKDVHEPHRNARPFDTLPSPEVALVDMPEALADLLDAISDAWNHSTPSTPLLFLDCQGVELANEGNLSLIQLYISDTNTVYIIDVQSLQEQTFIKTGKNHATTLKILFEDRGLVKAMWDCRISSEVLFNESGVILRSVVDIQLLENAVSNKARNHRTLLDLGSAVYRRLNFSKETSSKFFNIKSTGKMIMDQGLEYYAKIQELDDDSSTDWTPALDWTAMQDLAANAEPAIQQRPLHPSIMEHCAQEVAVLPMLLRQFVKSRFWTEEWKWHVQEESAERLRLARAPYFDSNDMDMTAPPKHWLKIKRIDKSTRRMEAYNMVTPTWFIDEDENGEEAAVVDENLEDDNADDANVTDLKTANEETVDGEAVDGEAVDVEAVGGEAVDGEAVNGSLE